MTRKQKKSYTLQYIFENVKILRVIDGDTIEAEIDMGFKTKHTDTFRLARINAWEMRGKEKEKGIKARYWLHTILSEFGGIPMTHGWPIKIQTFKQGKYGRYLCEIWMLVPLKNKKKKRWLNINDALVEKNHAKYQKY